MFALSGAPVNSNVYKNKILVRVKAIFSSEKHLQVFTESNLGYLFVLTFWKVLLQLHDLKKIYIIMNIRSIFAK